MTEKRKYPRFECSIKTNFDFFPGNPDEIDTGSAESEKGSGYILDISEGGAFVVSSDRLGIGTPIILNFTVKNKLSKINGRVSRIGLLNNNPSEVAKRLSSFSDKGDAYIGVEFNTLIPDFKIEDYS